MQFTRIVAVLVFLVSSFVASNVFAQGQNNDYCQRHPEIFDSNGRLTLDAHKKIHMGGPEWWYDSQTKTWKEWPSKTNGHTLDEYQELTGGPYWYYDSQAKEWKEWPKQENKMTLDCYKKIFLSGPQWWYDSQAKEWKQWPK